MQTSRKLPSASVVLKETIAALCHEAVKRALLLSAACGASGSLTGCHTPHTTTQAATTPESARQVASPPLPDAPATPSAQEPPAEPPLLRSNVPTVHSTSRLAPFPCAQPPLTDADYDALNARGDEARQQSERERWTTELSFRAHNLTLSQDVDYLEITRTQLAGSMRFTDGSLPIDGMPLAKAGTACSQAADVAHCNERLEQQRKALFAELKCNGSECPEFDFTYALTTHGSEVRSYRTPDELRALLGTIDTPHEAWLWLNVHKHAYGFACETPDYAQHRQTSAGFELVARMVTSRCRPFMEKAFTYRVQGDGTIKLLATRVLVNDRQRCVVSGRRPAALAPFASTEQHSAGQMFAHMAYLESAAVLAFTQLEHDLAALGAPEVLLREVRRARQDEIRHATQMSALAREHVHAVPQPRTQREPPRGALDVALENAVEGCVRELFGALVARFQAERAEGLATRAVLARIADDEAAHAALSWRLAVWLESRLSEGERGLVSRAQSAALHTLECELFEPSEAQRRQCGMPSLSESRLLFASLAPMAEALADLAH